MTEMARFLPFDAAMQWDGTSSMNDLSQFYRQILRLEMGVSPEHPKILVPGDTGHCRPVPPLQLFLYRLDRPAKKAATSRFLGQRQPLLTAIELDEFAKRLSG